jgi:hypothetical protein
MLPQYCANFPCKVSIEIAPRGAYRFGKRLVLPSFAQCGRLLAVIIRGVLQNCDGCWQFATRQIGMAPL